MLRINPLFIILTSLLLTLAACDDAGWEPTDPEENNGSSRTYFGPKDIWELELVDDGNFTLSRKEAPDSTSDFVDASGTFEVLSSGFTQFTVTNPVSGINSSFTGLEIADDTIILEAIESSNRQIVALTRSGSCPVSAITGNWIKFKFTDSVDVTNASESFFGTWRYTPVATEGGAELTYESDYNLSVNLPTTSSSLGSDDSWNGAACSDGIISDTSFNLFPGNSYTLVDHAKDDSANNEFIYGLPVAAINGAVNFDGDYIGYLYQEGSNTLSVISADCGSGLCTIYEESDVANISRDGDTFFSLNLDGPIDTPSTGFISGSLEKEGQTNGNVSCGVVINFNSAGNELLACVAQLPAESIADAANIFLISID